MPTERADAASAVAPAVDAHDAHPDTDGGATALERPPLLHRAHHDVAACSSAQFDSDVAQLVILGQKIIK